MMITGARGTQKATGLTTDMGREEVNGSGATITPELLRDAESRRYRYTELFAAHALLDRTIVEIYHAHREKLRVRTRPEEVCAFLFGKATKTMNAIRVLCEGGFGQDAVILTRSLVNLVIDLWYIGGDPDERTEDYIANGRRTRRTYQEQFPERPGPLPALDPDWDEVKQRASLGTHLNSEAIDVAWKERGMVGVGRRIPDLSLGQRRSVWQIAAQEAEREAAEPWYYRPQLRWARQQQWSAEVSRN